VNWVALKSSNAVPIVGWKVDIFWGVLAFLQVPVDLSNTRTFAKKEKDPDRPAVHALGGLFYRPKA
jgi:hypothetical protein